MTRTAPAVLAALLLALPAAAGADMARQQIGSAYNEKVAPSARSRPSAIRRGGNHARRAYQLTVRRARRAILRSERAYFAGEPVKITTTACWHEGARRVGCTVAYRGVFLTVDGAPGPSMVFYGNDHAQLKRHGRVRVTADPLGVA